MKAEARFFVDFLSTQNIQMNIPIFQRKYEWEESHCEQLWNDILNAGSIQNIKGHFIGSIVYVEGANAAENGFQEYQVIDGQQRITTIMLLLEAFAQAIEEKGLEGTVGVASCQIRSDLLHNSAQAGERRQKLILTKRDKGALCALLEHAPVPVDADRTNVMTNFKWFQERLALSVNQIKAIYEGIKKIKIVEIALKREEDNPQLIFESMNSTGKLLSETDMIRNFILMDISPQEQNELYERFWDPMELMYSKIETGSKQSLDRFVRDYLTIKRNGAVPVIDQLYEQFKRYYQKNVNTSNIAEVCGFLNEFARYAEFYAEIGGLHSEKMRQYPELDEALKNLRKLKAEPANPFLLQLFDLFDKGIISDDDFVEAIQLVESYVFRRAICERGANSLTKTFATLFRSVKLVKSDNFTEDENFLDKLKLTFLSMQSKAAFPTDSEFRENFLRCPLFLKSNRCLFTLQRLEKYHQKEIVEIDSDAISIEHIMPQNIHNSENWKIALGEDWKTLHKQWVHTVGNLTLTGYNSKYSNRSFEEKINMVKGYKDSNFSMTRSLARYKQWTIDEIRQRGKKLAKKALEIWAYPALTEDTRDKYSMVAQESEESFEEVNVKKMGKKVLTYYRKATKENDAKSQNALGVCYYYGEGITQDLAEAVKWYRLAADQGNKWAQWNLGDCYYNGEGVDENLEEAAKWYWESARQGHACAQNSLGDCYYYGNGVDQNFEEAVYWYRKAATRGRNSEAQYNLGFCYENGEGVEKDILKALEWYEKAAEQGGSDAQFALGDCYEKGKGVKQDIQKAIEWYQKAAEQENSDAQFALGFCYEKGNGVKQNIQKAIKWYQKAAEQEDAEAQEALERLS